MQRDIIFDTSIVRAAHAAITVHSESLGTCRSKSRDSENGSSSWSADGTIERAANDNENGETLITARDEYFA